MTGPSHGHHTEAGTKIMLLVVVPGMLADSVICTRKKKKLGETLSGSGTFERLIFGISLLSYL